MDYNRLIDKAKALLPKFSNITSATSYEEYGVLYSEMLFLYTCISDFEVKRIVESGTARGQSTLLLSLLFPDKKIVSIEFDKNSPNVAIADTRLRSRINVKRIFGDSRVLLPQILEDRDVVMIDGPKMFVAVRLGLRLLSSGKTLGVFLHDMNIENQERKFLNKFFPEALFSDFKGLAQVSHVLDESTKEHLAPNRRLENLERDFGYGFALAWIPHNPRRSYSLLILLSYLFDALSSPKDILVRIRRKFKNKI